MARQKANKMSRHSRRRARNVSRNAQYPILLRAAAVVVICCMAGSLYIAISQAATQSSPTSQLRNTSKSYTTDRIGIQAITGGNSVNVRWNFKPNQTGIKSYIIYRNGIKAGTSKPGQTVNYVDREGKRYNDTKIKPGMTYKYQIASVSTAGKIKKYPKTVTAKTPIKTTPIPTIELESAGNKDLDKWAKTVVVPELKTWYPKLSDAVAFPDYAPPKKFKLKFSKGGLAVTSGTTITLSTDHFSKSKDDVGTVIHEVMHVIQGFSGESKIPTWLMEGSADYGRNVIYADKPVVAKEKHYYTSSYQPTAAFLDWVERNYEKGYVRRVNIMGHERKTTESKLKFKNGKNFDQAWADMLDVPIRSSKDSD